ncbi:unnamed protein product [Caenorhabditis sp. 36 PRJEB53466]|nr:unnamed protein product [Caenorhabditis sp. 36 PRJEB53466]
MRKIPLFLICFCNVFGPSTAWDRIRPLTFRRIFPYSDRDQVWKLTFEVNHQNSTEDAQEILNLWMDNSWKASTLSPEKPIMEPSVFDLSDWQTIWYWNGDPKWKVRSLCDKEHAREQALMFLEHRAIVKIFIRYMFRSTQEKGMFTEEEARTMRDIFWEADNECENMFSCTEYIFLKRTFYNVRPTNFLADVYSTMQELIENFRKLAPVGEKLDFRIDYGVIYKG